ncbi:MAG: hypothetical protein V1701_03875 [Planctomycetota bacterium]
MATIDVANGLAYTSLTADRYQAATPSGYGTLRYNSSWEKLSQTYYPIQTGDILAVELRLSKNNSPAAGYIWVEIWYTSGGSPSSLISGAISSKIKASDISDSDSDYKFYFPTGINLTYTSSYAIVLCGDYASSSSNYIKWGYTGTNPYTDGHAHIWNGSTWSHIDTGEEDFWFKTYIGTACAILLRSSKDIPAGIGTMDPASTLDVNGSARITGLTMSNLVVTDASKNLASIAYSNWSGQYDDVSVVAQTPGETPPTYTTRTSSWARVGNMVFVKIRVTINQANTGSGYLIIALPVIGSTITYDVMSGFESAVTGKMVYGFNNGTTLWVRFADANTVIVNSYDIHISGCYRAA